MMGRDDRCMDARACGNDVSRRDVAIPLCVRALSCSSAVPPPSSWLCPAAIGLGAQRGGAVRRRSRTRPPRPRPNAPCVTRRSVCPWVTRPSEHTHTNGSGSHNDTRAGRARRSGSSRGRLRAAAATTQRTSHRRTSLRGGTRPTPHPLTATTVEPGSRRHAHRSTKRRAARRTRTRTVTAPLRRGHSKGRSGVWTDSRRSDCRPQVDPLCSRSSGDALGINSLAQLASTYRLMRCIR